MMSKFDVTIGIGGEARIIGQIESDGAGDWLAKMVKDAAATDDTITILEPKLSPGTPWPASGSSPMSAPRPGPVSIGSKIEVRASQIVWFSR